MNCKICGGNVSSAISVALSKVPGTISLEAKSSIRLAVNEMKVLFSADRAPIATSPILSIFPIRILIVIPSGETSAIVLLVVKGKESPPVGELLTMRSVISNVVSSTGSLKVKIRRLSPRLREYPDNIGLEVSAVTVVA